MKTLVAILSGRGPKNIYDEDRAKTFHNNNDQDVVAFYDKNKFPDWKSKHVTLQHNGMPYTNTVSNVGTLRNTIMKYAEDNGYKQLWMIDDDVRQFYHYNPYTKEDLNNELKLTYTKFDQLPKIEHAFGGCLGGNFKRYKLATGQKYSHQMPVGCLYFDLEKIKKIIGHIPTFEEKILLWDDYDFFLNFRKYGIIPETFNEYAFIKPQTQDQKVAGNSIASSGIEKVCTMGFNLYKRYGSENCICKKKLNIVDVAPAMTNKFFPVVYRHRIDSLEHFLQDVYEDDNTKYVRSSDKVKKGNDMIWIQLFQNNKEPKKFRFGM